jgi:Carboxypeptidase regulatory-like domain
MPRPLSAIIMLLISVAWLTTYGQKNSGQSSEIKFVVLKDDNGKPVRNASVILHPVGQNGKQAKGGFQLKTDAEGKTETEGVPYGLVRVQVIAPGFQTFGDDYTINQPEQNVIIRLKRPRDQYTIYDTPGSNQPKDKQ